MFLQLIGTLLALALSGVVLLLMDTIFKTVAARRDFIKRAGGLKMADKFSIWAGHVNSYVFAERQMYLLDDLHRRFKAKTVGLMFGRTRFAATVDLDLLREVVLERKELNRTMMNVPIREAEVDCILMARDAQWVRIRKALAPALKPNIFMTQNVQREIEGSVGKLIEAIDRKFKAAQGADSIELNMDDYAHRYSLDLVFSCFYKQYKMVDFDAQVDPMSKLTHDGYEDIMSNPLIRLCTIFPALKPALDWLMMRFHRQGAWRAWLMRIIKQQLTLHVKARKHLLKMKQAGQSVDEESFALRDGTKFERNMIDYVLDKFYHSRLELNEYLNTTWFLMSAADKTTSDSVAHLVYQLATHCDIQQKLRESILAEGERSEYLSWAISESLRLLPSAPIGCSRTTTRDYKCADGIVPADTFVLCSVYSIHRLEQYWGRDADKFRPERFADTSNFHPLQFMPFGAGLRACPGREFAVHVIKKLVCALLTRYKFLCEPVELRYNSPYYFLQIPDKHVHIKLTRL